MIKRKEQMHLEVKENMRDGKGSINILHLLKKDEIKGNSRLCAKITINPGDSIGLHSHDNEEEIFYVISGKGEVNDDGVIDKLNPGDVLLTGDGAKHSVKNVGDEALEMIAIILLY